MPKLTIFPAKLKQKPNMYRIIEEKHLITKRRLYFIQRKRSFLGFKWWTGNLGVDEIDLNAYGFFYTEKEARRALNIIKTGKTIIERVI